MRTPDGPDAVTHMRAAMDRVAGFLEDLRQKLYHDPASRTAVYAISTEDLERQLLQPVHYDIAKLADLLKQGERYIVSADGRRESIAEILGEETKDNCATEEPLKSIYVNWELSNGSEYGGGMVGLLPFP
jgi:hypothetical protein